jgi:hypothetical protein
MGSHPSYRVYLTSTYPSSSGLTGLSCLPQSCSYVPPPVCRVRACSRYICQLAVGVMGGPAYVLYSSRASSTASKNAFIPSPVIALTPTAWISADESRAQQLAYSEIIVKLLEDQTHAAHQTVHVTSISTVRSVCSVQCSLVSLEIFHPLKREIVWFHVNLVEHDDKR